MLLNMHENGKVNDEDPWNGEYFRDLRRRHLQGDLFWPCESCVYSVGVEPSRVVKGKIPFKVGQREATKNTVAGLDEGGKGVGLFKDGGLSVRGQ